MILSDRWTNCVAVQPLVKTNQRESVQIAAMHYVYENTFSHPPLLLLSPPH